MTEKTQISLKSYITLPLLSWLQFIIIIITIMSSETIILSKWPHLSGLERQTRQLAAAANDWSFQVIVESFNLGSLELYGKKTWQRRWSPVSSWSRWAQPVEPGHKLQSQVGQFSSRSRSLYFCPIRCEHPVRWQHLHRMRGVTFCFIRIILEGAADAKWSKVLQPREKIIKNQKDSRFAAQPGQS